MKRLKFMFPFYFYDFPYPYEGNVPCFTNKVGPLCSDFIRCSWQTWEKLKIADSTGITLSEPTITEENLIFLQHLSNSRERFQSDSNAPRLYTQKYSQQGEKQSGADWEWWIGDETCLVGLRIQAKRLKGGRYPSLDYSDQSQLETLIKSCEGSSIRPMYCFYNYQDPAAPFEPNNWKCQPDSCNKTTDDECYPLMGCSLSSAYDVQNHAKNTLEEQIKTMFPWHCLVCCTGHLGNQGESFGKRINSFLNKTFQDDLEATPLANLPPYVSQLLGKEGDDSSIRPPDNVSYVQVIQKLKS